MVDRVSHRQRIESLLPGFPVEEHLAFERIGIEDVREMADGVREVHQPIVEGPFPDILNNPKAKNEVGRVARV